MTSTDTVSVSRAVPGRELGRVSCAEECPDSPDQFLRVTRASAATSRVRFHAGRRVTRGLARKCGDDDSSAPERQLRSGREAAAAVFWRSRNPVAGRPAPLPHRSFEPFNRGAPLEGTTPCVPSCRRHPEICVGYAPHCGETMRLSPAPARPAHQLPQQRPQPARHAFASRAVRAATRGSSCGLWSGHDVAEGAPLREVTPQLGVVFNGPVPHRPDERPNPSGRQAPSR